MMTINAIIIEVSNDVILDNQRGEYISHGSIVNLIGYP